MPMEDTDIPCPDCGKFLTDVDGMLECQGDYVPREGQGDFEFSFNGCGGTSGYGDQDWMVWYPGKNYPPNPTNMDIEARRAFMKEVK